MLDVAYCYRCISVVATGWSMSVCWSHSKALKKRLNGSRCHLGGPKEPHIRWGSRFPKEQYLGLSSPLKSTGVSAAVQAAKKSTTDSAQLLQPIALLPTGRCHTNFSRWKICPHLWCGLSPKLYDLLIMILTKHANSYLSNIRLVRDIEKSIIIHHFATDIGPLGTGNADAGTGIGDPA